MTNAPERLWAEPSKYPGEWTATAENITVFDVEYVRADLSQAAVEAALREAVSRGYLGSDAVSELIQGTGALDRALEKAREEEREACARIADKQAAAWVDSMTSFHGVPSATRIAAAIRARGEGVEG